MMIYQNKQLLTVNYHYYYAAHQVVKHIQGMYSTYILVYLSVQRS